jgi:hypothetical protein
MRTQQLEAGSPLTNGWDDDVGVGDTLLRRFVHHHAATASAFAVAAGGRVTSIGHVRMADTGRPSGFWNSATLLRPVDDWNATVGEVTAAAEAGTGDLHLWSAWPVPDLSAAGWVLEGHPPLLVRPPHSLVPVAGEPTAALCELTEPTQMEEWEQVVVDGYPLADVGATRGTVGPAAVLDDPRVRCWLGRDDRGSAVSAATSFVSHGLVSLALGVTTPRARGCGHWRSHAITRLRVAPHLWAAGLFSDLSRPLAESIGFVPITRFTLWRLPRP